MNNEHIRKTAEEAKIRKVLSREEMTAALKWFESQMAVCYRYGVKEDGTIGWVRFENR